MDSLQDDKIHEAIKRRKRLIKQGKKENFEGIKVWKKICNPKSFATVKSLTRIGIYIRFLS